MNPGPMMHQSPAINHTISNMQPMITGSAHSSASMQPVFANNASASQYHPSWSTPSNMDTTVSDPNMSGSLANSAAGSMSSRPVTPGLMSNRSATSDSGSMGPAFTHHPSRTLSPALQPSCRHSPAPSFVPASCTVSAPPALQPCHTQSPTMEASCTVSAPSALQPCRTQSPAMEACSVSAPPALQPFRTPSPAVQASHTPSIAPPRSKMPRLDGSTSAANNHLEQEEEQETSACKRKRLELIFLELRPVKINSMFYLSIFRRKAMRARTQTFEKYTNFIQCFISVFRSK